MVTPYCDQLRGLLPKRMAGVSIPEPLFSRVRAELDATLAWASGARPALYRLIGITQRAQAALPQAELTAEQAMVARLELAGLSEALGSRGRWS